MITVRRAKPTDADDIAAAEARYIDCPWTKSQIASEIINSDALFFVAEDGTEFVGYLSGVVAADECEISNIAVEQAYRRRGIGRALFDALFESARSLDVKSIYLLVRDDNAAAVGLYKKLEFSAVGKRPRYYNGRDALIMRRNL